MSKYTHKNNIPKTVYKQNEKENVERLPNVTKRV